jgi:choloylglycine hydrolase
LSLSDATGDSALAEIVDGGKLRVYHDRKYTVMTNSPPFPQQLANLKRYKEFGGTEPLPGTSEPADRFVRALYYLQNLPRPTDLRETYAWILSIMRNVAQPFTKSTDPAHPEAAGTYWRSVTDSTNRVYFFESTLRPNIVWVSLDAFALGPGAPAQKLDLVNGGDLIGDVTAAFKTSEPFAFREGGF